MNTSGEAADQVVKMVLNGTEVLLKLTGSGAKNAAVLLYTMARQQNKTKGAEHLSNMLRSGKKLRVYTFDIKDLAKFKDVAKQYGILYTVLKEKDNTGGVFDVMVRADDDNKIARVIERFNLTKVDTATLRAQILKEKEERAGQGGQHHGAPETTATEEPPAPDKTKEPEDYEEGVVAALYSEKPIQKEAQGTGNPTQARADDTRTEDESRQPTRTAGKSETEEIPDSAKENPSEPKPSESTQTDSFPSRGKRESVRERAERISRQREAERKRSTQSPELPKVQLPKEKER